MNRLTFSILLTGLLPLCPTVRAADKQAEKTPQKGMDAILAKAVADAVTPGAKTGDDRPVGVSGEQKNEAAPAAPALAGNAQNAADTAAVPLDCVAPIKEVIRFYEIEARIVKVMMDGWNTRIAANIKRRDEFQAKCDGQSKKIQELQAEKTKAARREAAQIKHEMAQTKKDIAAVKRELKMQCRELDDEMKMRARDSQNNLRDAYQLAQTEVAQKGAELSK
jgi:hypothetical protein